MQTVVTTSVFERQAKAAGVTDRELAEMIDFLAENPETGTVIPGTGGARKVRFRSEGKGKSGGYRTVHYYAADDVPVFLLALVKKGARADISQAERNELARILPRIAAAYRQSVRDMNSERRSKQP